MEDELQYVPSVEGAIIEKLISNYTIVILAQRNGTQANREAAVCRILTRVLRSSAATRWAWVYGPLPSSVPIVRRLAERDIKEITNFALSEARQAIREGVVL